MAKNPSSVSRAPSQRQLRAGELIRQVLAEMFQQGEVHDAQIPDKPVTITEVKASPDLRNATVYCSILGQDEMSREIAALNKAAPRIRAVLGRKIDMKHTPALHFKADETFEEAARISSLLRRD